MNQNDFTLVGMIAMLAILMTREVLNFLDKKKPVKKFNNPVDMEILYSRVGEIHKRMDNGDTFRCIRPALERLEDSFKRFGKTLDRIEDKLSRLS